MRIKKLLIGILVLMMALQLLQYATGLLAEGSLSGAYHKASVPKFSIESWHAYDFQGKLTHYFENNFGFRPQFIRLNNQLYYWLFNKSNNGGIVIGKEGYLFEGQYIDSYFGNDFLGEQFIDRSVSKLETVQRLLREYRTELFVVITPNKARYYSEYLPDRLLQEKHPSNYEVFMKKFEEKGIQVVDANKWFFELKGKTHYPIMVKHGTHWSQYGATIFGDTLLRYMESRLDTALYHFVIEEVEYPCFAEGSDKDLEDLMNIYTKLNEKQYAYPRSFHFIPNANGYKPNLIAIGDSFFWSLYRDYFVESFYTTWFWYYFSSIYPQYTEPQMRTVDLDVIDNILKNDILLIVTSTDNLKDLGFGFVDYVYDFLTMEDSLRFQDLLPRYERSLRFNEVAMEQIRIKAVEKQVSVDSMVRLDAEWLVNRKLKELENFRVVKPADPLKK